METTRNEYPDLTLSTGAALPLAWAGMRAAGYGLAAFSITATGATLARAGWEGVQLSVLAGLTAGALTFARHIGKDITTIQTRPLKSEVQRPVAALPAPPAPVASLTPAANALGNHYALTSLLDGPPSLARLVLGVTATAGALETVTGNLSDLVHIAVGGSSGFGKSVFLRALAYQFVLAQEQPDLVLIDLEGVTFSQLARSPRLLYPIADDEQTAAQLLTHLSGYELNRRKALFAQYPGIDNLADYNAVAAEQLRPIVTMIDEGTALLGDRDVETALKTVALRARKYGLWIVLAGQDWKATSMDSAIKNQLSTTVQFRAKSPAQSRALLGVSGAEALPAELKGRALAQLPGRELLEIQTPYLSSREFAHAVSPGPGPQHAAPDADAGRRAQAQTLRDAGQSVTAIARTLAGVEKPNARQIEEVRALLEG